MIDILNKKKIKEDDTNKTLIQEVIDNLTIASRMRECYINRDTGALEDYYKKLKNVSNFNNEKSDFFSKTIKKGKSREKPIRYEDTELEIEDERTKGEMGDGKIALRLVIIEAIDSKGIEGQSFVDAMSPFSTMVNARKTKKYQCAVVVGPWIFEWNESCFVVPKKCYFNATYYVTETGYYIGNLDCSFAISESSRFVTQWNRTKSFDPTFCNAHHFVDGLFKCLTDRTLKGDNLDSYREIGLKQSPEIKFPKTIVADILRKWKPEMASMKIDLEFVKRLKNFLELQNAKLFSFANHTELDIFLYILKECQMMDALCTVNPEFLFVLRAYDRLFWLAHFDGSALTGVCYRPTVEFETNQIKDGTLPLIYNEKHECHFNDVVGLNASRNHVNWWEAAK